MNKPTIDDILEAMREVGRPLPGESIDEMARRVDMVRLFLPQAAKLGADAKMRARSLADDIIIALRATIRAAIRAQGVTL